MKTKTILFTCLLFSAVSVFADVQTCINLKGQSVKGETGGTAISDSFGTCSTYFVVDREDEKLVYTGNKRTALGCTYIHTSVDQITGLFEDQISCPRGNRLENSISVSPEPVGLKVPIPMMVPSRAATTETK